MDFLTSDTHYGHANIIKYSKRPFETVEEMDEALIANHNALVRPGDTLYHLGDFAFCSQERAERILQRLNGNKHLIYGNHDKGNKQLKGWASVSSYKEVYLQDGEEKFFVVLFHYGQRVWNKSHYGSYQLFGHSHGSLPTINNKSTDVGVDCWDYRPVTFSEVRRYLRKFPALETVDHHKVDTTKE